jgi:hypothetical protein
MSFGDTNKTIVDSPWLSGSTLAQMVGFAAVGYAAGRLFQTLSLNPVQGLIYGTVHFCCQKTFSQINANLSEGLSEGMRHEPNEHLAFTFKHIIPAATSFGITNYLIGGGLMGAVGVITGVAMPIVFTLVAEPLTEHAIRWLKNDDTWESINNMRDKVADFFHNIYTSLPLVKKA